MHCVSVCAKTCNVCPTTLQATSCPFLFPVVVTKQKKIPLNVQAVTIPSPVLTLTQLFAPDHDPVIRGRKIQENKNC